MGGYRIVVGVDGSRSAGAALRWAVREAARLDATVLVVTAWRPAPGWDDERRRREYHEVASMQRRQINHARAEVRDGPPPVVAREIVSGDAVTALRRVGAIADLVVLGAGDRPLSRSVVARLAAADGPRVPVIVVPPAEVSPPAESDRAPAAVG